VQDEPVALVTGANRGIRHRIAKDLAAHGFTSTALDNFSRGDVALAIPRRSSVQQGTHLDTTSEGATIMRVFVTGATGFVGSATVPELLDAGHQVLGLARSDEGARSLIAAGAEVHRGDLEDLGRLRSGAAMSDGVIHAAFDHDFARFAQNAEADRRAIEVIGDVLEGSDRPLIVTSGLPLTPDHLTKEDDVPPSGSGGSPRVSEQTAIAMVGRGVRASVVRMSQVDDRDRQGLTTYMIALAREKGVSAYGNG